MRGTLKTAGCVFLALFASASAASAAGDAGAGKVFAETACASCHLVSPDQKSATTEAPPFAAIAMKRPEDEIETFLTRPHPPMPPIELTRQEISDVVAYIESLK